MPRPRKPVEQKRSGYTARSPATDPASRRLFGVPVVVSNAQAAGVAHALASDAVALDTDTQGVSVTWSETSNADDWSKNLIRARCEGRFATGEW